MLAALLLEPAEGQQRQRQILLAQVTGAIGVASTEHICGVIEEAGTSGAEIVVLQIDTPGGLLSATRDLIQCILASARPVAVYVAPSGARAASAGTYIAHTAHIAAMAPGTHLGAATPVVLGLPSPLQPSERREDGDKQPSSSPQQSGVDQKVINDAVAYLKGLAQLRGRNAEWAEKAVREAATLTASKALAERVADILADDIESLLQQMHGRTVEIGGSSVKLSTAGAPAISVEPDWRLRLLAAISDPNIAFILLMIGFYGILFEFWSPGAIVPGVVGGICLILAFMALSVLPLSYGALAWVLLGLGLMTAEAFAPGVGILGIGGLVAFVVGANFLFDPKGADFDIQLACPVIIGAAATSVLLFVVVLGSAIKARQRPPMTGAEEMIGLVGEVVSWSERAFAPGDTVRVTRRHGLKLIVEPAQP
jgi:membrane-bound serine protease (ClpP class)